eukprot:GFUD01032403.1.p1 GENE.GFUD01032403.1~~GFUD01032403.1.p1  ORF type:complete len:123 (-),score=19.36 GFUD01032403.1:149-517(-)
MGILFRQSRKGRMPTEELTFFDKIFDDLASIVWQDQLNFKGSEKDFRFNTRLLGFGSYKAMLMEAARRIHDISTANQKNVLCMEMEGILRNRKPRAQSYGDGEMGHRRAIQMWEEAICIVRI